MEESQGQCHPQLRRGGFLAGRHRCEVHGRFEDLFRGQLCGKRHRPLGRPLYLVSSICLQLQWIGGDPCD